MHGPVSTCDRCGAAFTTGTPGRFIFCPRCKARPFPERYPNLPCPVCGLTSRHTTGDDWYCVECDLVFNRDDSGDAPDDF